MKYYTKEQLSNALSESYAFITLSQRGHTLYLSLNRPDKKNAIHPHMVNEIAFALQYAKENPSVWTIVIKAEGDVFCSGADLKAFMGMTGEYESSIPKPAEEVLLGELLPALHKPIVARVHGDVYAGGFFFLAGSTYVVAAEDVKLGLPEVKRGLFPFQVMASLLRVMPERKVLDWCIRGYNLPVQQAAEWGLVTHCVSSDALDTTIDTLLSDIEENSPTAIRMGLEAFEYIKQYGADHKYLMDMLQKTVGSKDGMEGIMAFREKRKAVWSGE
jgi:enoyl-CoA hydratase/carnithine racemase